MNVIMQVLVRNSVLNQLGRNLCSFNFKVTVKFHPKQLMHLNYQQTLSLKLNKNNKQDTQWSGEIFAFVWQILKFSFRFRTLKYFFVETFLRVSIQRRIEERSSFFLQFANPHLKIILSDGSISHLKFKISIVNFF